MISHVRGHRALQALRAAVLTCCAISGIVTAGAAAATDPELRAAAQLRREALQSDEALGLVRSLTTEVGPRLAGTPGDHAGVEWAMQRFQALGFTNVRKQEVIVPHWVRGEARFELLEPHPQSMVTLALGGSIGTSDEGIVAPVLRVADFDALRTLAPDAARGQIVYFAARTPRTRDGSGYGRTVRQRVDGASAAAALGAVGIVIRSVGTSDDRIAHTGAMSYNIAQPRIPAVAISNPDADLLDRQLAAGIAVRARLLVTARDLPQRRSANVIAEVPGTERADEIVLLGAHLDSWDPGHGALDDAAGVAIVIAAARLIARSPLKPRRTIRVVLYANEEFGLTGAARYAAEESGALERHALAMEADLGAGPVYQLSARVAESDWPLVRRMQRELAGLGVELGTNTASGGADLAPLRRAGVPVLAPQLDATHYFDVHHTVNDTLDKVDPKALQQSVAVFAVAAFLAARHEAPLARLSGAETTR